MATSATGLHLAVRNNSIADVQRWFEQQYEHQRKRLEKLQAGGDHDDEEDQQTPWNVLINERSVGVPGHRNETALIIAVKRHQPAIVRYLIEQGVSTCAADSTYQGLAPLHALMNAGASAGARAQSTMQMLTLLLENGARVDQRSKSARRTPLMMAAEKGLLDVVKKLIEYGADVAAIDNAGSHALMIAVAANRSDIARELFVNAGADKLVDTPNNAGRTVRAAARLKPRNTASASQHDAVWTLLRDAPKTEEVKEREAREKKAAAGAMLLSQFVPSSVDPIETAMYSLVCAGGAGLLWLAMRIAR